MHEKQNQTSEECHEAAIICGDVAILIGEFIKTQRRNE